MPGPAHTERRSPLPSPRTEKPFIDQNLQIHLPLRETSPQLTHRPLNPIYTHYVGAHPSIGYLLPQINEEELYQAMNQADQAYLAWKSLQGKIKEKIRL